MPKLIMGSVKHGAPSASLNRPGWLSLLGWCGLLPLTVGLEWVFLLVSLYLPNAVLKYVTLEYEGNVLVCVIVHVCGQACP